MKWKYDGRPVTTAEMDDWERRNDRAIPAQYRQILSEADGGNPLDVVFEAEDELELALDVFLGIHQEGKASLDEHLSTFAGRIPSDTFPCARTMSGDLVLISTALRDAGSVHLWEHEEEAEDDCVPDRSNVRFLAVDLETFVRGLKRLV